MQGSWPAPGQASKDVREHQPHFSALVEASGAGCTHARPGVEWMFWQPNSRVYDSAQAQGSVSACLRVSSIQSLWELCLGAAQAAHDGVMSMF